MRLIRIFGFTAVAAAAAMALIGASSASASLNTQLCKVHEEPCKAGNAVTTLHLLSNETVPPLLSFFVLGVQINIECESSLGKASVLGLGTAPTAQIAHLEELTWVGCKRESNGAVCTVITTKKGLLDILRALLNLGTVRSLGTSAEVKCTGLPTCTYGGEPTLIIEGAGHTAFTGNGMLNASPVTLKVEGGGLCPSTASWKALYEPLEKVFAVS